MFLRTHCRLKDGKEHRYWSIVENHRTAEGRVVQRQVLYLGEINDSQKQSWCRTIEVLEEGRESARQVLEAHEHLVTTDETNRAKFQDVMTFLRNRVEEK